MIRVQRPKLTDLPEWVAWYQKAMDAAEALKKEHKPDTEVEVKVDDDLYKEAMPFLLALFNEKCAYCESLITNTHPGDVEHYRPKGRISNSDGSIVKIKVKGKEIDHPGYWWLCYEWSNLLPSCIDCNRRRWQGGKDAAPTKAGKADLFPIGGQRAVEPTDPLAAEQAMLIDPSEDDYDPEQHFEYSADGKIQPRSKRAQETCDLFGFNTRETLFAQRALAYTQALAHLNLFLSQAISATVGAVAMSEVERAARKQINEIWGGRAPYSSIGRLAIQRTHEALKHKGIKFELPLPLE